MSSHGEGGQPCYRKISDKECRVADVGLTDDELSVLTIARYYFAAFADPNSHAWVRALTFARCAFGEARGALIAAAVLDAVQEIRMARRTMFHFSNPECPACASVLCECERHFIGTVMAISRGQQSELHAHTLLLCEGNDSGSLIAAASELASLLPPQVRSSAPSAHFVPARST